MNDQPAPRERLAAIDVGSNSIRLLIADWDPVTGLHTVDELRDQPRLATGLDTTGALDPAAIDAAIATLGRMADVCARRGVSRMVAVATSAVRDASNGPVFRERVRTELGIDLEIITPEREARLSWLSVAHHFRLDDSRVLVADIGGGSLELVAAIDGLIEATSSLPLGAVRLTEQHPVGDAPAWQSVAAMRKTARKHLRRAMPWREWRQARLIGSGGSFTNLARIALARRGVEADTLHGTTVRTGEVESLLEWLTTMTVSERARVPGINPDRADIILAGIAVTAEVLDRVGAREVTVSAYGIREGLLLEMLGESRKIGNDDPLRTLREFVDYCRGDRQHAEQVRLLALQMHDALAARLGSDAWERQVLEAAALLHDTGQVVSFSRHHHHSYRLIVHADGLALGARERALVALVARYHRKKGPSRKHDAFAALDRADQQVVRRLAGLLRVADGLDRGHTSAVPSVTVTSLDDQVEIVASKADPVGPDLSLEIWAANRKKDVLEDALGCDVVIRT